MRLLLVSSILCILQGLIVGKCIDKREKRAICGGGIGGGGIVGGGTGGGTGGGGVIGGCPGLPGLPCQGQPGISYQPPISYPPIQIPYPQIQPPIQPPIPIPFQPPIHSPVQVPIQVPLQVSVQPGAVPPIQIPIQAQPQVQQIANPGGCQFTNSFPYFQCGTFQVPSCSTCG